jgi:hypothetical protein
VNTHGIFVDDEPGMSKEKLGVGAGFRVQGSGFRVQGSGFRKTLIFAFAEP